MPILIYKILAVLLIIGACFWYFKYSQNKIESLITIKAQLDTKVSTLEESLKVEREQKAKQVEAITKLSKDNLKAQRELNEYLEVFKKHDFTKLAKAKPGLIEKIINEGTQNLFKEIEDATSINTPN